MATKEPTYRVLLKDGKVEVREYQSYCVVETVVPGSDFNEASNAGFRKLFQFISGNNRSQKSIAMTAPVTASRSEKIEMTAPVTSVRAPDGYCIGFVMPEGFTKETTPTPNDSTLKVRDVPARSVAVIRFSGVWSSSSIERHEQALKVWISAKNYEGIGESIIARYDPPFMPWFLRRNEIQIEIRSPQK